MAGLVCGFIPGDLAAPPAAAGAWQAVALDALLAAVVVTGLAMAVAMGLWWSATQASVTLLGRRAHCRLYGDDVTEGAGTLGASGRRDNDRRW